MFEQPDSCWRANAEFACGRDGRVRHNLGFRMLRVRVAPVVQRLVGVAPTGKMVAGRAGGTTEGSRDDQTVLYRMAG
jgi:hypothetical protein